MIDNIYKIEDGKLTLNLHPGQTKVWESKKRFIFALAGTQSGKSSFAPWWLWKEIQEQGSGDYLMVAPTYPLMSKKLLPEFMRVFHHTLEMGRWWAADQIYELKNPETGEMASNSTAPMWGRVIFGSAKNAESLESATAKAAVLDEVGQNAFSVSAWEAVLRRLSLNRGRVFGGTTLYNLGWLKQRIYDPWKRGEDPDIDVIQFKSIENPMFSKEEYYRARNNMPLWKFKMFYEGEFDKPAGMIYDAFNFETQVIPPFSIPGNWPLYVGVDFGGVNMAAIFTAKDPDTGRFFHFDEYLQGGKSIGGHAENFKRMVGNRPLIWVGGAAPEEQWREEFRQAGIPLIAPPIKDVEAGISRVYGYHKRGQIFVFKTMSRYLDQIGKYSRELDDMSEPTEKIEDKNAFHILDAERVLFAELWERGGGVSGESIAIANRAYTSKWATTRPSVAIIGDGESRWKRGRRY